MPQAQKEKISAALRGVKKSPMHVANLSAAQIGKTISVEHKQKLRQFWLGKKHSAETIEKRSASVAAAKGTPEARAMVSVKMLSLGLKRSPETIKKMSAAAVIRMAKRFAHLPVRLPPTAEETRVRRRESHLGKITPPDVRMKLSLAALGKTKSDATRERMRIAARAREAIKRALKELPPGAPGTPVPTG